MRKITANGTACCVQTLVAQEEEVKKRATTKKSRYTGPVVRFSSKKVNGEAMVSAATICYAMQVLLAARPSKKGLWSCSRS